VALDERPDPELTAFAARLLLDSGDPRGATNQLEAGAQVHGWDSETSYLRALAAARACRFEEAIAFARDLVTDPELGSDAELLVVHLLLETGDLEGARRAVELALQERPDSTDLLLAKARVAEREGKVDEQLAFLERAQALDPDNQAVRTWHGISWGGPRVRREGDPRITPAL
jgi:tetratricopeptide (TPR) repeat protein